MPFFVLAVNILLSCGEFFGGPSTSGLECRQQTALNANGTKTLFLKSIFEVSYVYTCSSTSVHGRAPFLSRAIKSKYARDTRSNHASQASVLFFVSTYVGNFLFLFFMSARFSMDGRSSLCLRSSMQTRDSHTRFTHEMHTRDAHTRFTHEIHTRDSHTRFTHEIHTRDSHARCTHEIHTRDSHTRFTHEIYARDSHTRFTQEIHTRDSHTRFTHAHAHAHVHVLCE